MRPVSLAAARIGLCVATTSLFVAAAGYLLSARRASERSTMPTVAAANAAPVGEASPRAEAHAPAGARLTQAEPAGAPATQPDYRVAVRLIDALASAKLDVRGASDRQLRGVLSAHWRRHLAPYSGLTGETARLAQSIGLSRQGSPLSTKHGNVGDPNGAPSGGSTLSKPPPSAAASGPGQLDEQEKRERKVKVFGLGEGSYDQRECIVLPPPATVRFQLRIPRAAKLRAAPAVLGEGALTFRVSFRRAAESEARVLGTLDLRGPSRRFKDWVLDLDAAGLGDQAGELELSVEAKSEEVGVGLWGSPVIVAREPARAPYNVLFVIVDAMRSDAIAASHDSASDEERKKAKFPPLDAWFPAMPEVAPELDRLASEGVIWEQSWSAAMWTRPATLSILTGLRASHTGLEILALELLGDQRRRFYERRPPLLPRLLRDAGASTAAFVNNMYLSGSVGVGIDFGIEELVDHRQRVLDTQSITTDALAYLDERKDERFFLLLNYASPHAPYEPTPADVRAVRKARNHPDDFGVQNYLAEVHKDDAAIGAVLKKLGELGLREKTLVVVTADHGETMSSAHDMVAVDVAQGVPSGRFTHLSTMWEEAARVPIILSLPGTVPGGLRMKARAQTIDLVPSILEIEHLPIPKEVDGRSLLPELEGKAVEERPVVVEGRGARSIIDGHYHLIVRDPVARRLRQHDEEFERAVELYDLANDPGERREISAVHPDVVAPLRAKLESALASKANGPDVSAAARPERLHFRFSTSGRPAQLEFVLHDVGTRVKVTPIGIEPRAVHVGGADVRIASTTSADHAVGFDLEVPSGTTRLRWSVALDGKPWPAERMFGGTLGMVMRDLADGVETETERTALESVAMPHVVAGEELGMFVTREPSSGVPESEISAEAQLEAQQAMQAWGYARKPPPKKPE